MNQDTILRLPAWLAALESLGDKDVDFDNLIQQIEDLPATPISIEDIYTPQEAMAIAMATHAGEVELPAYLELEDFVLYAEDDLGNVIWNDAIGEFEPAILPGESLT